MDYLLQGKEKERTRREIFSSAKTFLLDLREFIIIFARPQWSRPLPLFGNFVFFSLPGRHPWSNPWFINWCNISVRMEWEKKGSLREVNAKEIGRKGWNSFARNVTRGRRKEGRRDGYVVTGWLDSRVKMDEAACYEILSDRSSGHWIIRFE